MGNFFDKEYKNGKLLYGSKPNSIIIELLNHIQKGKVLDLGCGYGRNALFLAQKGFDIECVDNSEEALKLFSKLKNKKIDNVVFTNKNVADFKFKEKYDIILSINLFQFLKLEQIKKLIDDMKAHTEINGFNVISAFTEDNQFKNFGYLFRKGELKRLYSDWNILDYSEYITEREKHGVGKLHRHGVVRLIAQKIK